ncbi:hypothetical protein C8R44DRAFT_744442 [Mycena epipterygia]|nr:hypothetical protein C8R44DRAFT_744442 [Mycena epipterygia]
MQLVQAVRRRKAFLDVIRTFLNIAEPDFLHPSSKVGKYIELSTSSMADDPATFLDKSIWKINFASETPRFTSPVDKSSVKSRQDKPSSAGCHFGICTPLKFMSQMLTSSGRGVAPAGVRAAEGTGAGGLVGDDEDEAGATNGPARWCEGSLQRALAFGGIS